MSESAAAQSPESILELQAQVRELERELLERSAQIRTYEQHVRILEEALRVMRADRYGASREKLGEAPGQRSLFNEVEVLMDTAKAVDFELVRHALRTPPSSPKPWSCPTARKRTRIGTKARAILLKRSSFTSRCRPTTKTTVISSRSVT